MLAGSLSFLALIIAIVIHEIAHGLVAYRYGDPTAKQLGRLSLNPLVHVDLLGTILLPGLLWFSGSSFLLGWAKPVPVNTRHFKNPEKAMVWVAFAGPLSNITIALIASIILSLLKLVSLPPGLLLDSLSIFAFFLIKCIDINLILAIFNLIPIPPLDGSRIIAPFLPFKIKLWWYKIEPYGFLILFFLLYTGIISDLLRFFYIPIRSLFLF